MTKNISIIGIGRLGICVGLCLEFVGYNVLGVDINNSYVNSINNKTLKSGEPSVENMLKVSKNFRATTDIDEALKFSDIIFIYVATPSSGGDKHYDHTMLGNVLMKINERKAVNKHIVIGCTVIPGYVRDVGNYLISDCVNTTLSYNPEFIAQGNIINGVFYPDFVLIGEGSKEAGDYLEEMYTNIFKNSPRVKDSVFGLTSIPKFCRMSPSSAEITKLSVNCFITTKIAFANMIGDLADITPGANKNDILKAVGSDARIGSKYIMPGYPFGGPCFPRDNRALGSYISQMGIDPLIPNATDKSNKDHTIFQAKNVLRQLTQNNISEYIIIGAGYKEPCTVPIIEESGKLKIGKFLAENGIKITVRDIKSLIDATKLEYGNLFIYEIVESL